MLCAGAGHCHGTIAMQRPEHRTSLTFPPIPPFPPVPWIAASTKLRSPPTAAAALGGGGGAAALPLLPSPPLPPLPWIAASSEPGCPPPAATALVGGGGCGGGALPFASSAVGHPLGSNGGPNTAVGTKSRLLSRSSSSQLPAAARALAGSAAAGPAAAAKSAGKTPT